MALSATEVTRLQQVLSAVPSDHDISSISSRLASVSAAGTTGAVVAEAGSTNLASPIASVSPATTTGAVVGEADRSNPEEPNLGRPQRAIRQGGRRLRANRSNPEEPNCGRPQNKRSRGAGKPKKKELPPLNVQNILEGMFEKPKVALSWRKSSFKVLQHHAATAIVFSEQQQIEQLQAAINLLPEENASLSGEEHKASLELVLTAMSRGSGSRPSAAANSTERLPWHVVQVLLKRSARLEMERRNVPGFFIVAWPWRSDADHSFTPYDPRMSDVTYVSAADRALSALDLIINDYLARLMMEKAGRVSEIVLLARAVREGPSPGASATPQETATYREVWDTLLAVAALVQNTACTTEQIKALRVISSDLESPAPKRKSTSALAIFWTDPFWQQKREAIWESAADEGVAAPQLLQITQIVQTKPSVEEVNEAWALAQRKHDRWQTTLREGALSDMVEALELWCKDEVNSLQTLSVGSHENLVAWVLRAKVVRSRMDWLHIKCDVSFAEASEYLDNSLSRNSAEAQLAQGMCLITTFLVAPGS